MFIGAKKNCKTSPFKPLRMSLRTTNDFDADVNREKSL